MCARLPTLVLLLSILAAACDSGPPTTIEGWAQAVTEASKDKEKAEAAKELKRLARDQLAAGKDLSGVVPALLPLLKEPAPVRSEVAWVLGEIGDKKAVQPLIDAIDYAAAVSDKDAARANGKIAEALGKLKDPAAVPALVKLAKSRDAATALAAVQALGKIGDASAVDALMAIVEDDSKDNFLVKNAIEALGAIGDPKALPLLVKMLFVERRGVSFYREASFAIFQIGEDSTPRLIDILEGKDKEIWDFAKEKGIYEAAIFAKAAQVLGDLGDRRATKALVKKLSYESEYADMRLLPRMFAAEALGRIRDRRAAKKIAQLLDEEEANARKTYAQALVLMGDRSAVGALAESSTKGMGYGAREESQRALARLGGPKDLAKFDAATKKNLQLKTCMDWFEGDKEAIKKNCEKAIAKYKKNTVDKFRPMLEAAAECKDDAKCWVAKLDDPNPRVREKALWELGRLDADEALDAILQKGVAEKKDLEVRFAALNALDSLLFGPGNKGLDKEEAKKASEFLGRLLEEEKGKNYFVRINEDTKRVKLKIDRALRS